MHTTPYSLLLRNQEVANMKFLRSLLPLISLAVALPMPASSLMDIAKEAVWIDMTDKSTDKDDPARQMLIEIAEKSEDEDSTVAMLADFVEPNDHTTARMISMFKAMGDLTNARMFVSLNGMTLADFHHSIVENPYPPGSMEASAFGGGVSVEEIERMKGGQDV